MNKVAHYLDCGCAIMEDGRRVWCPTCLASPVPPPMSEDIRSLRERVAKLAMQYKRDEISAVFAMTGIAAALTLSAPSPTPAELHERVEEAIRRARTDSASPSKMWAEYICALIGEAVGLREAFADGADFAARRLNDLGRYFRPDAENEATRRYRVSQKGESDVARG